MAQDQVEKEKLIDEYISVELDRNQSHSRYLNTLNYRSSSEVNLRGDKATSL